MRLRLLFSAISLSLLISTNVQAVGVGVKPTNLALTTPILSLAEAEFLVINVDNTPAIYQITFDDFSRYLSVDFQDFQLQPGESQLVKIKAQFFNWGVYQTNISVVARPLGAGGLVTGSGVKLPVIVTVSGLAIEGWIVLSLLVLGLIIIFIVLLRRVKRGKLAKS